MQILSWDSIIMYHSQKWNCAALSIALMLVAVAIAKFEVKMIWASVFCDNPSHRVNHPRGKGHLSSTSRHIIESIGFTELPIWWDIRELDDVWGPNPCSSNGNTCTKGKGDIADLNGQGTGRERDQHTSGNIWPLHSHPQFPCVLNINLQKLWTQHVIQCIFCTIKSMKI